MSRKIRTAVGILLSLLLLGWALRDVSFSDVMRRVQAANLGYFILAVVISVATMWIRAIRWGILLRPVAGNVPFKPRLAATFIGFTVNNLLPGRIGEFARVVSLSRLTSVSIASAFATLVIERVLDGVVIIGLMFAAMALPGFPMVGDIGGVDVAAAATVIAGVMLGIGCGLGLVVAAPRLAGRLARQGSRVLPNRMREPALGVLRSFAAGLGILRSPVMFLVSALLALGQWTFAALSFLYAFRAFDINIVPFSGAVFLQSLLALAVSIPSSPGFFGPFEAASRGGLDLWGVGAEQAVSFAIAFHIGGFIPVTVIGLYYIWSLNLSWSSISHSDEAAQDGQPLEQASADRTTA